MIKTVTNLELIQMLNAVSKYENYKLPQKISFAIMSNTVEISEKYELYIKQLNKLIEEYNEKDAFKKDENGQVMTLQNGIPQATDVYFEEFDGDLGELLNCEVDVNLCMINFECFNYDDARFDVLSMAEMIELKGLLCE